jgi:hypothetical protein
MALGPFQSPMPLVFRISQGTGALDCDKSSRILNPNVCHFHRGSQLHFGAQDFFETGTPGRQEVVAPDVQRPHAHSEFALLTVVVSNLNVWYPISRSERSCFEDANPPCPSEFLPQRRTLNPRIQGPNCSPVCVSATTPKPET